MLRSMPPRYLYLRLGFGATVLWATADAGLGEPPSDDLASANVTLLRRGRGDDASDLAITADGDARTVSSVMPWSMQ